MMISHIALWIVVGILSLLILAMMRQIGVLNERVFPAGALMTTGGPNIGEQIPAATYHSLVNTPVHIGGPQLHNTLLLFVSPNCPICKTLLPFVKSVTNAEHPSTRIILASDAEMNQEQEQHRQFVKQHHLSPEFYLLSRPLGLAFYVAKLPFAVIIDNQGILRAKGMVNSREHLESLFEAQARGVGSLQDYLLSQR